MKTLIISIIIIIITSSFIYSQKDSVISDIRTDTTFIININPKLPDLIFHYTDFGVYYDNNPYDGKIYYTVVIINSKNNKTIQTIHLYNSIRHYPLNYDYGYGDQEARVEEAMAVDINFDGYKDIRFLSGRGMDKYSVNEFYYYYIYNPQKNVFEPNEDVSSITNPTPFVDEKIVRSFLWSGNNRNINEFKWAKNRLVLLKSIDYIVIEDSCKSDTDCKFTRVVEYYENGEIVNTGTEIINITEIPDYH